MNKTGHVEVDVRPGTLKDAILFNLKANREANGLAFGPGDITKSCKTLLTSQDFAGWPRKQISEAVGCTYGMVSKVARRIGLPPAKTGVRPIIDPMEVARKLESGMTHQQIADELGVSVRSIYRREISSLFDPCPHCHGSGKVLRKTKEKEL